MIEPDPTTPAKIETTEKASYPYDLYGYGDIPTPPPPPRKRLSKRIRFSFIGIVLFLLFSGLALGAGFAMSRSHASPKATPTVSLSTHVVKPTSIPATPAPTATATTNSLMPNPPYARDVANHMMNLDGSDIYKTITDGWDTIVSYPYIPERGTAGVATNSAGWYTVEAFDTTAQAYQDFETIQNMNAALENTCILIQITPQIGLTSSRLLTAFSNSCPLR